MAAMEKYEKIKPVGRGAFSTVSLYRCKSNNELVIIKQIPVEDMTTEERQLAVNEVKVLKLLKHPNIIDYYESFFEEKSLMIVMEYAQGGTLDYYIQQRQEQNKYLEEEEILKILAQIVLGLSHIHGQRVLHRDLKARNILLNKKRKVVKIGDFGISKMMEKTNASTLVGTPHYLSPEQCQNYPYNHKSDIWALGCILFELASLKKAFDADNINAIVCKIIKGQYPQIPEFYSDELKELIKMLLSLDPKDRPPIQKIMAMPIIVNALFDLQTDIGRIPCKKLPRPVGGLAAFLPSRRKQMNNNKQHSPASPKTTTSSPRSSADGVKGHNNSSGILQRTASTWETISSLELSSLLGQSNITIVYIWGGNVTKPTRPGMPQVDQDIVQVVCSRTYKMGLTMNGRVLTWDAQMAPDTMSTVSSTADVSHSNETTLFTPRFLEGLSGVIVDQISCGDMFAAVLTDRGILLTFGNGTQGCLGHGDLNDVPKASIVRDLVGCTVVQVSCGASHAMALTEGGKVYAWGKGDGGRLGLGVTETKMVPTEVSFKPPCHPCKVMCGFDCSFVLTKEKTLYACGKNKNNKLALAYGSDASVEDGEEVLSMSLLKNPPIKEESIKHVAMGTSHTAFLTEDGVIYTVGANTHHQLGYQKNYDDMGPQRVTALEDHFVTHVACGSTFSVAITQDGDVYSWGKGGRGRLGQGNITSSPMPTKLEFPNNEKLKIHSLAVSHSTTIIAGKLMEQGNMESRNEPTY